MRVEPLPLVLGLRVEGKRVVVRVTGRVMVSVPRVGGGFEPVTHRFKRGRG